VKKLEGQPYISYNDLSNKLYFDEIGRCCLYFEAEIEHVYIDNQKRAITGRSEQ
jgi:hypothetical protein